MREKRLHLLDDLRGVEIYIAVAETSSIARAAHRLGILPSTASKKIAELEARAQARLLHRTTRHISMTEVGQRFYDQCLRLLNEAERAEWELRDETLDPRGRMRVTAPVVFAQRQIAPLLPDFLRRYPGIEVELVASARTLNLIEEGCDLSIRLASTEQAARSGRVLAENHRVVCASRAYLDLHGEPTQPTDLTDHSCLVAMSSQRSDLWRFHSQDGGEAVRVKGPLVSDNASTLAMAAVQGLGIAMLGTFVVADYLRDGLLQEVLSGKLVQDSVIVSVVPERSFVPHRINLFVDYLKDRFGSPPLWDRGLKRGPVAADAATH